jgi:hypothetical protein
VWAPMAVWCVIMICLDVYWFMARSKHTTPGRSSIIHVPPGGCPPWTLLQNGFFERNGVKADACYNPAGDGTIDVLYPGESFVHLPGGSVIEGNDTTGVKSRRIQH